MHHSILNAIGNTPLVEINRLNPNPKVKILAKIEYVNPGGSIKDRPALSMIENGEKSGALTHDKIVIEATSGNTGIGLAMVCAIKGYKLLLAMSEAVSVERRKILAARGAEILLTPGHLGTDGAIEEVYRIVREDPDRYFMTDQYNNDANWKAHYSGTAEEIIRQTDGRISAFVATIGTTGTVIGVAKRFREYDSNIKIIGVEPYLGHKIQGLKNLKEAYRPEIFDKRLIDEIINIDDDEAFEMTRRLGKEEGLFVGMSSGAAMVIAAKKAAEMTEGTIVVIFPDSGERYLSTPLFAVKKKVDLHLFNTMSRSKEPFEPIQPGKVSVYSCGPTADARMHIEECRRFVFSDILCRYLEFRGYSVNHVMNITDFDDKTIQGSESAGEPLSEFTQKYIDLFKQDLERLMIQPAEKYPRASEHIDDMVDLAKKMMDKGVAYEKLRSLYFNIGSFPEYGKLSGVDLNKIKLGATVDLDEYEKNNPRDFTLMKRARLSELKRGIYVKTEWGNVRPSWHIQCAAMSMKCLGESYDIHTSSRELVFPHHENELAIAKAVTGKPLAKFWIHCERVLMENKATDDEKQLLPTLDELVKEGFSAREIRFWLISNHYRKPLTFSRTRLLIQTRRSLKRIDSCVHGLMGIKDGSEYPDIDQLAYDIKQGFISAMDDDLNFPRALVVIFNIIKKINILIKDRQINSDNAAVLLSAFQSVDDVIKIFDFNPIEVDPGLRDLMGKREAARNAGDFEKADQIREELRALGINIQDLKI
ncbi:MAG: cysteine--tRNA ligase [Desulfobacteraceae bacterium]|nr:cysteine--tRNA ligase [Desulfobacteraceae bacterium]MBC2757341.1 cysteine--tRNA ligase [Desulfobacteraceae bacterium]MBC2763945.1 cysteine--tRNA ligase [ANME-2 cluster archaeon]